MWPSSSRKVAAIVDFGLCSQVVQSFNKDYFDSSDHCTCYFHTQFRYPHGLHGICYVFLHLHHFSGGFLLEIIWEAYQRKGKDAGLVFDLGMFDYGNHGDRLALLASTYKRCPLGNSTEAIQGIG